MKSLNFLLNLHYLRPYITKYGNKSGSISYRAQYANITKSQTV